MVKGSVGVIACPMLEDELVYALCSDPEEKDVFLIEGDFTGTIRPKLEMYGVRYEMKGPSFLAERPDEDGLSFTIMMNPMKLHSEPAKLKERLQAQIGELQGRFDVIMMFYAMCGNYGWDISEWARSQGFCPVTVFRDAKGKVCDDCVGVAVGGTAEYYELIKKYAGNLFLTPAFATNWDACMTGDRREWEGFFESYDEMMRYMFQMGNYKYALKVDTGLGDRERYDACCEDVASRMGLKVREPDSEIATARLALDIYEKTKSLLGE